MKNKTKNQTKPATKRLSEGEMAMRLLKYTMLKNGFRIDRRARAEIILMAKRLDIPQEQAISFARKLSHQLVDESMKALREAIDDDHNPFDE